MEKDKMHLISQISKETVSEKVYYDVYNNAIDSIRFWTENSLKAYLYEKGNNWLIDSVLCFNSQNDKCVMALLNQDQYPTSRNDGINFFYGVNINGKWYFFKGPFIVLFRENYQKDIHTPLSFEKLHEIALDNIFHGYLKKKDKGFWGNLFGKTEWEVNEAFFQGMAPKNQASSGYGSCFECKTEEEYFLYLVKKNWGSRDTTNYEQSSTQ